MKKNALVAGCAGFLGSWFTDALLEQSFNVWGIDNLSTGNLVNLEHLKTNGSFVLIKHDITKRLPKKLDKIKFDLIVNFACPASPPKYKKLALETLETSSTGVKNLLELARKNNCRFFHTSTSEVYGDPKEHPQKESYFGNVNPYGVRSMYDEGKRFAESLIWVYRNKYQLDTGIARIFNTYGPRMDPQDGRVVTKFILQALAGKPLTVEGDGTHTRSLCFVSDQIAGLMKLALSDLEGPLNIGNDKEITINELADLINQVTDNHAGKVYIKRTQDDPNRRRPDLTLAKKLLGWKPIIGLEEGLKITIECHFHRKSKLLLSHNTVLYKKL